MKLHEYAFDVKLFAAIRVKAESEAEARRILDETQAASVTMALSNGAIVEAEASTDGEADLFEIDGDYQP